MASTAIANERLQTAFDDLEKRSWLVTNCTVLWRELSDHFVSLEHVLEKKSQDLMKKAEALDLKTKQTLEFLEKREISIDENVEISLAKVDQQKEAALIAFERDCDGVEGSEEIGSKLRSFCRKMDSKGFWKFVVSSKKDLNGFRSQIPEALLDCIDPAKFVLNSIDGVFPVNKGDQVYDQAWGCILLLESLVPVLADPVLGFLHPLVTPNVKEQAKEIAEAWKAILVQRGGVENVKSTEVHTFLQHVVTFGIAARDDDNLYQKLIVGFSWRKQMPKLAISLGLKDRMPDIIEELISKGKQVDAVHFIYDTDLVEKFPPIPLLKSYLKSAKDEAASILKAGNNSLQAAQEAGRKEQAAHRAVIKCIEEHKLEPEFPLESLHKRVNQLEKAKLDRKKSASAANKRTRASNGGPLPPAKAGRLTKNGFAGSGFLRSPSNQAQYPVPQPYSYDRHLVAAYGGRSPPALADPFAYPVENGTGGVGSYPYAGYGYQQAYYR